MASKVLLVEDDNNLREIYEARLMAEGYEIALAQDGEEALVVAKKEHPDLIISDVMMPRVSGFDMLDILRNTDGLKDTKVIMLTALGQAEDRSRADQLGADRYLVKSQVTLEDIVKSAQDLLTGNDSSSLPPLAADPPAPTPVPDSSAAAPAPDPVAPPPPPAPTPPLVPPQPPAADPPAPSTAPEPVPPPVAEPKSERSNEQLISEALKDLTGNDQSAVKDPPAPSTAPEPVPPPAPTPPLVPPQPPAADPPAPTPVPLPEPKHDVKPSIDEASVVKQQIDQFVTGQTSPIDPSPAPVPAPTPPPPAPSPQNDDDGADDSVVVAHKKIIEPIKGEVKVEPDINELLKKEAAASTQPEVSNASSAVQAPTSVPGAIPGSNVEPPHAPGHVISPSGDASTTTPGTSTVDPNSIAL